MLVFLWLPTCSLFPRFSCIQEWEQDLLSFIRHFLLLPPTLCIFLSFLFVFLCLLPLGRVNIFNRTKEMAAVTEKEKRNSWTVMDSRSCCMCSLITPSALLSLYVLISVFHRLLTLPWHFHSLPLPPLVLVSLLTSATTLSEFWLLLIRFLIPHPTASLSFSLSLSFFLFVSVPTRWCGQSPCSGLSVSWLTEGSQSLQYKHETISKWLAGWLCTVETSLHISLSQARFTGLPINHISR